MNDDELLKSLGKAIRDEGAARPERALEGALDDAFDDRLFERLGVSEAKANPPAEVPRNVIPFPPNRARSTTRVAGGLGMMFAAAAAVFLMQRGSGEAVGAYELTAQSERLERGAEEESMRVVASVGRPLTLVLRPSSKTTATPDVAVFAHLGGTPLPWATKVEASNSGAMRVTITPDRAGTGELRVVLSPKGDANAAHARTLARPLEVRETP